MMRNVVVVDQGNPSAAYQLTRAQLVEALPAELGGSTTRFLDQLRTDFPGQRHIGDGARLYSTGLNFIGEAGAWWAASRQGGGLTVDPLRTSRFPVVSAGLQPG